MAEIISEDEEGVTKREGHVEWKEFRLKFPDKLERTPLAQQEFQQAIDDADEPDLMGPVEFIRRRRAGEL